MFFYRALRQEDGKPLDRGAVAEGIRVLSGEDAYHDDNGFITRATVDSDRPPQALRFYRVRRDGLPGKDDGRGRHGDLGLAEEEGLAEAIHMRLFRNGVIGAEFFFYGPRVSRFALFLRNKLDLAYIIRPLVRRDAIEQALRFGEIRLLRLKFDPSAISQEEASAANLAGLMDTAADFHTGVYADLTLRSERNDQSFTQRGQGLA